MPPMAIQIYEFRSVLMPQYQNYPAEEEWTARRDRFVAEVNAAAEEGFCAVMQPAGDLLLMGKIKRLEQVNMTVQTPRIVEGIPLDGSRPRG